MSYRLRRRKTETKKENLKSKKQVPCGGNIEVGNEYDADSENEVRKIKLDCLQIRSDSDSSCEDEIKKRKAEFTNILNKFVTPIVSSKSKEKLDESDSNSGEDKLQGSNLIEQCVEFKIEARDILKSKKVLFIEGNTLDDTNKRKRRASRVSLLSKENITPPDQSTPAALMGKATYQCLNESLFGFHEMECSLSMSPMKMKIFNEDTVSNKSYTSTSTYSKLSSKTSPMKRKKHDLDQTGFNDIPVEMPRKKTRRKKEKVVKDNNENEEFLENLRMQFKEIEMHELAIE